MSKWKCEICGNEFDNFHALGFDNKIYCPLCYFKKLSADLQVENEKLKKQLEEYEIQNINLREDIMIKKMAFPNNKIKDKTFYNLYDMPSYEDLLNQQQEFIKYLEDKIHTIETTYSQINGNYGLMNEKLETLKKILQKYKSIIGNDINVGSKGVNKDEKNNN